MTEEIEHNEYKHRQNIIKKQKSEWMTMFTKKYIHMKELVVKTVVVADVDKPSPQSKPTSTRIKINDTPDIFEYAEDVGETIMKRHTYVNIQSCVSDAVKETVQLIRQYGNDTTSSFGCWVDELKN